MKKLLVLFLAVLLCGCAAQPAQTEPAAPSSQQTLPQTTAPTQTQPTAESSQPSVEPSQPEGPSLLDFLKIATQPVGSTMYVWGGGWNEADTGAGTETVTLGLSPRWAEFFEMQDASYDYQNTRYQIHDGLDCSGYVGWAVYNTLEKESGGSGYVFPSTQMAEKLAQMGMGTLLPAQNMTGWQPGDVMSMQGHCWIAVAACGDGSVLLLHSSPPGVRFCGTGLADGSDSQAIALAEAIMQERYPDWYARYPDCACPAWYLERSAAMRWSETVLPDREGLRGMTPEEVIRAIFEG